VVIHKVRILIKEAKDKKEILSFIKFPWRIYKDDPYWVPPLIKEQLKKFSPQNPFFSHAKLILLLAYQEDEVLGRIAGIIDHNYVKFHNEKVGFFGFFESIPEQEVSWALLSEVREWLKKQGMEKMAGPMNPSTNDECGLLIQGFDSSPCLMMPYNPAYYPSLLEQFGLRKAMDLYAYWLDKETFISDRLFRFEEKLRKKEPRLWLRNLNLNDFKNELRIIKEIYNLAWTDNWGFVPMTEEEIDYLAKELKPLAVPELVLFAYMEKEPIGFSVSLPDYNNVLKHLNGKIGVMGLIKYLYYSRKIKTLRIMLLGVKKDFQKRGAEALLYIETFKRGIQKGYKYAECSWVLENNLLMQRGIEAMGGKHYKTYRIYEMAI